MATDKKRVGFIGVGFMGHGMAKNLVEKGWPLTVMGHRNRAPVEDLLQRGAREAKTPRELAAKSDIVFICVTSSVQVEGVTRGDDGLIAGAHDGLIVVDASTADPTSTLALGAELEAAGAAMADSPLGGTPTQAEAGELSAMVGASDAVYAAIEPAILAWAARSVHLGPLGMGHKMKLLNNFLSMGYAAIYSEALAIGAKAGVSPQVFHSVIDGSRMDSGFYQTFMKYVLERDRDAHKFTLNNGNKDLRYLLSLAESAGVPAPIAAAAKNSFFSALAAGKGDDFVPMLSDHIAGLCGASLAPDRAAAAGE